MSNWKENMSAIEVIQAYVADTQEYHREAREHQAVYPNEIPWQKRAAWRNQGVLWDIFCAPLSERGFENVA